MSTPAGPAPAAPSLVAGLHVERHLARVAVADMRGAVVDVRSDVADGFDGFDGPDRPGGSGISGGPRLVDVAEIDLPAIGSPERVVRLGELWAALDLGGVPAVVVSLGSPSLAAVDARSAGVEVVGVVRGGEAVTRALVEGTAGLVVMPDVDGPIALVVGAGGFLPVPNAAQVAGPLPGFVACTVPGVGSGRLVPGAAAGAGMGTSGDDLLRLAGTPRRPLPLRRAGEGLAADSPAPDDAAVLAFGAALLCADLVSDGLAGLGRPGTSPAVGLSAPSSWMAAAEREGAAAPRPARPHASPSSAGPLFPPASPSPTAARQGSLRGRASAVRAVLGGALKGMVVGLVAVAVFASPLGDRRPFVPAPDVQPAGRTASTIVQGANATFATDCTDVARVVLMLGTIDVPLDTTLLFEGTSPVLTATGRACAAGVATALSYAPMRGVELVSPETARVESFAEAVRAAGADPTRVRAAPAGAGAGGLKLRFTEG